MLLAKTSDKVFNGFKVVQNVDINTNKKTGEDKYFFTILLMKGREIVCCNDSELITKEQAMKLIKKINAKNIRYSSKGVSNEQNRMD